MPEPPHTALVDITAMVIVMMRMQPAIDASISRPCVTEKRSSFLNDVRFITIPAPRSEGSTRRDCLPRASLGEVFLSVSHGFQAGVIATGVSGAAGLPRQTPTSASRFSNEDGYREGLQLVPPWETGH